MAVRKVVALIVVSKCELCALLCEITRTMWITYLLGSIFCTSSWKYVKWGSGKKWMFLSTSQGKSGNSQGIVREYSGNFDLLIGHEPCSRL